MSRISRKKDVKRPVKKRIKKVYKEKTPKCMVTFRLPKEAAPDARHVTIVGDFNNWNLTETPLKKLKNGDFKVTLELDCNREYKFRYLIDANHWENDPSADKCSPCCYGYDDSEVVV
jgi:1,4-alpha-glucan branching enzyme